MRRMWADVEMKMISEMFILCPSTYIGREWLCVDFRVEVCDGKA